MRKPHIILPFIFACMFVFTHIEVNAESVFSKELKKCYEHAFNLNEEKQYFEAYSAMLLAQRQLMTEMQKAGKNCFTIGDADFELLYWPIKKSLAEIAYKLGLYIEMEKLSRELMLTVKSRFTEETNVERYNGMLADLAKIDGGRYYLIEDYGNAEIELIKALSLKPYDIYFVYAVRDDLAQLYYKQEKYDLALAQIDSILSQPPFSEGYRYPIDEEERMEIMSQRAICLARLGQFSEAINVIDSILTHYKAKNNKVKEYAEVLRKKAKILMLQYDATGLYNPQAIQCYKDYLVLAKKYIDSHFIQMSESEREQYWMAEQPFVTDCFRLENKAPELLYDVALFSKAVLLQMGRDFDSTMTKEQRRKVLSSIRVTWKNVQERMSSSSSAIEFITYDKGGTSHIGALVVKKNSSPLFVEIAALKDITEIVLASGVTVEDALSETVNTQVINSLYNDQRLYSLIWNDDLVQAIGQSQTVYFAADGIFHQIAIEYLLPQALESKRFFRLTSTRILTEQRSKVQTDSMLMCGGVDYKKVYKTEDREEENDELAYSLMASMRMSLFSLPGTLSEVDSIQAIRGNHTADRTLYADSVTETTLKKLMQKYHLVLISTHGYFAGASALGTDINPSSTDTQLSQSCLFLSGSEKNMKDKTFNPSYPDGVLSAREISKMDFSNIDLVVLSACMSGLGYITPDGVFGLQRGLKTAGVKAIIASLWDVNDVATSILMTELYANLEAGLSLYDAFYEARQALKNTTIRRRHLGFNRKKSFDKPSMYDAFILIDGIE